MFCRNCGKELIGTPELCMNCGARPLAGNSYCSECGAVTDQLAEIYIKCSTKLRNTVSKSIGKSKTISVLLAVFLSYWTWLYTYRKDVWKFWTGIGITAVLITGMVLTPWFEIGGWITKITQVTRNASAWALLLSLIFMVPLWLWTIIDTVRKSEEWYHAYPVVG